MNTISAEEIENIIFNEASEHTLRGIFLTIDDLRKVSSIIAPSSAPQTEEAFQPKVTPVMIKCPSCNTVQAAIVEHTVPFGTYIHHCEKCKYIIMESEWDLVKPFEMQPISEEVEDVEVLFKDEVNTRTEQWINQNSFNRHSIRTYLYHMAKFGLSSAHKAVENKSGLK